MSRTILSLRLIALERSHAGSKVETSCVDLVFPDRPELQRRYPIKGHKVRLEIVFVRPVEVQHGP